MRSISILLTISIAIIIGCKSQQSFKESSKPFIGTYTPIDKAIKKKLGSGFSMDESFDGHHALAWATKGKASTAKLNYGVWEISTSKLILSGSATNGNVIWLDNSTIIVEDFNVKGLIGVSTKSKIDIHTGTKTPILNQQEND